MKTIVCALAMGSLLICGACSSKPAAGETAEGADSTAVATDSTAVTDEAALPETPEAAKAEIESLISELQAALADGSKSDEEIQSLWKKYEERVKKIGAAGHEIFSAYTDPMNKFVEKNIGKLNDKGVTVSFHSSIINDKNNMETIEFTVPNIIEDKKDAAVETAKEKVNDAKAKATEKVEEAKQQAREKANEKVNEAAEKANKQVNEAAEKAKEKLNKKLGL